ncbi:MAG: flavin reductase [Pseudomonadota bacterium]|jgi:flavin reductase (DIM6/NTAB) family NADH-FMN oxidoreductase RutF
MSQASANLSSEAAVHHATARALIEAGDPAADGRALRRCLGQFPTGVTVVTARNGERLVGMAVNSFAAVSLTPPLVLWSIRRESSSAQDFLRAGHYAVSVLADDQVELSQLFGSSHPERFERARWHGGLNGAPLIEGAIAHLECRLEQVHEGGDHLILVGHVERHARYEGAPLLFTQGRYGVAQEHPALAEAAPQSQARAASELSDSELLRQLVYASQRLSLDFESHRQALGLTMPMSRLLNRLLEGACDPVELARATYLEAEEVADGLAGLGQQGLARARDDGCFELSATGGERQSAIAGSADRYMKDKLGQIAEADLAAFKRVLQALGHD